FAIEGECGVGLVEMVMRTDLDRAIAGIGDGQAHRRAARINLDFARRGEELARDHAASPNAAMTTPSVFSLISGKISVLALEKPPDDRKNRLYIRALGNNFAGRAAGEFRTVGRELAAEFGRRRNSCCTRM